MQGQLWLFIQLSMFVLELSNARSARSFKEQCETCNSIVDEFKEGLKKTSKSNFGGGNTKWEEDRLGKFSTSETRLVEIIDEYLCKKDSKECHHMLEESEELLEEYWFKVFGKEKDYDLQRFLCIGRLKVCCPKNSFGPYCNPCPGDKDLPCSGHGKCDGDGTRDGDGSCSCDEGYIGSLCEECLGGYYQANTSTEPINCQACDKSCDYKCSGPGSKACEECAKGYVMDTESGCIDVDECSNETSCDTSQYCVNNVGSYSCLACSRGCSSCTAEGQDHCLGCIDGYQLEDTTCKDVDECANGSYSCNEEKEVCVNIEGGYDCECKEGYENINETCVLKPPEASQDAEKGHGEL